VRLSDADRERLLEALSRHAAAGRLDVAELERRVDAIARAETSDDAAAVMVDLPPLPAAEPQAPARPRTWGRGHGDADTPANDWQPTGERFRDPRSGRIMRVWVDPGGGRHYVPENP
jgi:hypothetical protein